MATVQSFVNNPYQENTYILYDETGECVIIDPGMETASEQNKVVNFIKNNNLKPVLLLNTHCHIDHVLGNKFIFDQYGLRPRFHAGELPVIEAIVAYAPAMGIHYEVSPLPAGIRQPVSMGPRNMLRRVWRAERRRIHRGLSLPYSCAIAAGVLLTLYVPLG